MKKLLKTVAILSLSFVALVGCGGESTSNNTSSSTNTSIPTSELDKALSAEFVGIAKDQKVYLTTIGQNADFETVYNVLESIGVPSNKIEKEKALVASNVPQGGIVIVVPGASTKGMGSAGTNQKAELARAEAFEKQAAESKITLICIHTGGSARRGTDSDPIITASGKSADLMIVVNSGNSDQFFTNLSSNNKVPLYLYSAAGKIASPLKQLFGITA